MEKNVIGFFETKPSGCSWYRIKHPKDALEKQGITTRYLHFNEDIELDDLSTVMCYGAYPFSFESGVEYLKSQGKKTIYDIDDAYDLIEIHNPFYFNVKQDSGSPRELLNKVDLVTVSTENMAKYVKERSSVPTIVVPNCYVPEEWTFPRPKREGIRIGFAGSPTHIKDILQVLPAIKRLQHEYNITFVIFGFAIVSFEQWLKDYRFVSHEEAITDSIEFEHLMKDIKFEFVPYVDHTYYPQVLTNMALDIGLCPLTDTPFNRCRSASKAMEYTLSGALAVASKVEPYTNEPTSITTDDWYTTLKYYIDNPQELEIARLRHLEWLTLNRNINGKIDLLKSIYVV